MSIFCLVNGSTQNPLCWKLLVPELEKHGHQTMITPSLPVDEPAASGTRYAEVIAQALEDASDDAVLVGHSASGMFIPLVPSLRPIRRLVYLAALIPKPGASIRNDNSLPIQTCLTLNGWRRAGLATIRQRMMRWQ